MVEGVMSKQQVLMRKGEGEPLQVLGAQVKFLCPAEKTGRAWSLMEVVVPKQSGPPPHDHPWDEAYYVTHGQIQFSVAGEEKIVNAGDFLYAPAGTVHGFSGLSEEPARMLIIDVPAHAETFFRDIDREVKSPEDMPKLSEIAARNRIRFQSL